MGQAVADLPNPLDAPPPANVSGTDDLLAQLAGDEIDRLLAEADVERTPPVPAAAAPPPAPPQATPASTPAPPSNQSIAQAATPSPPAPTGDELDQLLSTLNPEPTSGPARPKTLTEQVPDVLAELAVTSPVSLGQGTAVAPQAPAGAAPALAPPAAAPAGDESLDAVMSPAEREALSLSNLEAATAAAEQQDASAAAAVAAAAEKSAVQAAGSAPARVNLGIRLLEMLNAPLSFIPDAARDPIGKAAIVTIVNSLAVLIYVLFVRH